MIQPRPYQTEACATILKKWKEGITRQVVSLPTGCHAPGTKILMFDGSLKNVENICVGDLLMGSDSTPRRVLSLTNGYDDMYRIIPNKGEPFVVNGAHILSLKRVRSRNPVNRRVAPSQAGGQIINLSVNEYLHKTDTFKHLHKLYRVPVEFAKQTITVDPYFLGVLLGDGSTANGRISVTKPDEAIISECYAQAQHYGLKIREEHREGTQIVTCFFITQEGKRSPKNSNRLRNELAMLGLNGLKAGEKFVPENYKVNTRAIRLSILAGLLDTDGSLHEGGFEFSSRSRKLADDVAFLSRSLGLASYIGSKYVNNYKYYRVSISGDCSIIPTKIPRKQATPRQQKKDVLVTGFSVEPVGRGAYYGFTVDGDNLYVIGDFTVTHNCGKTILFGMVAKALQDRTLVIAHREELLQQAKQKIGFVYPDADIGILQASERRGLDANICVASIQTAVKHIPELQKRGFKLAICDEAHHIVAKTYKNLFENLGFLSGSPDKLLLGVTATAFRADHEQLGDVFQQVVYERSILTMIKAGYLCDVKGLAVETSVDISDVKSRNGDFAVDDLAVAVDTPQRNKLVADTYLEYGENRHGIVFAVKVEHALHIAEEFRSQGISCEAVYGSMPTDQRRDILKRYAEGRIQILTNVAVLTEGWDAPATDIILLARPTQSQGLAIQMIGRGLRTAPGKKNCLVIDFVDTTKKHDLCGISVLHIDDEDQRKKRQRNLFDLCEDDEEDDWNDVGTGESDENLISDVYSIDIFDRSQFMWQPLGAGYRLWLADGSSVCCYTENGESYLPIVALSNGRCQKLADEALPLGYALGTCEDYVRQLNNKYSKASLKDAQWRGLPATDKQIIALDNMGITHSPDITRGEASALLESRLNTPPTTKQLWYINQHKLHDMPQLLTKAEASRIIERAKATEEPKQKKQHTHDRTIQLPW